MTRNIYQLEVKTWFADQTPDTLNSQHLSSFSKGSAIEALKKISLESTDYRRRKDLDSVVIGGNIAVYEAIQDGDTYYKFMGVSK